MKIDRKGVLLALLILWQFSVCAGADLAGISGFYYEAELSRPLPGALVALYKADDNLLVDYTYTRNDGAFLLKGPSEKGKYYVVATKDRFSKRLDFDYDPQTPMTNLMIQHHQPKSPLKKVVEAAGNRFDDVIKVLIGLFLGLWFKRYDDRRKARQTIIRNIRTIKDSADDLFNRYEALQKIAAAYGKGDVHVADRKRNEFIELAAKAGREVEELQKQLDSKTDLEEAFYTAHKLRGRDNYAAVRKALKEIKKLTDTIVANEASMLDLPKPEDRDAQLKPFLTLRDSELLSR